MENAGHYPPKALRYRLAFGRWILGLKFSTAATVCSTSGRNFFLQKKKSLINKSIRKTKSRQCDTIRVHWRRHSISFCCLFVFCFHLKKKKRTQRRRDGDGVASEWNRRCWMDGRPDKKIRKKTTKNKEKSFFFLKRGPNKALEPIRIIIRNWNRLSTR